MLFKDNFLCKTCVKDKKVKTFFKIINEVSNEIPRVDTLGLIYQYYI